MKSKLLIYLFYILCSQLLAQTNDFGTWAGIYLEKKLKKKITARIGQNHRLNENSTKLNNTFPEIGLSYRRNKNLKFTCNYRYILRNENKNTNRFNFDLSFRKKINKSIRFINRFRYQTQLNDQMISNSYLRNKFSNNYKLKYIPIDPYLATELYYQFKNHIIYNENDVKVLNEFNRYRLKTGINWSLDKDKALDIFYLYQKEFNVNDPEVDHIFGVAYSFQLN